MSILYLGLDPSRYPKKVVHLPIIQIKPRPYLEVEPYLRALAYSTHLFFTSRTTVDIYNRYVPDQTCQQTLAIGEATEERLRECGFSRVDRAPLAHAEGVVEWMETREWSHEAHVFYPHSSSARPLILETLKKKKIPYTAFSLYDTHPRSVELPDLRLFDQIVFTSPSCVKSFSQLTSVRLPREKCVAIGPITQRALEDLVF